MSRCWIGVIILKSLNWLKLEMYFDKQIGINLYYVKRFMWSYEFILNWICKRNWKSLVKTLAILLQITCVSLLSWNAIFDEFSVWGRSCSKNWRDQKSYFFAKNYFLYFYFDSFVCRQCSISSNLLRVRLLCLQWVLLL